MLKVGSQVFIFNCFTLSEVGGDLLRKVEVLKMDLQTVTAPNVGIHKWNVLVEKFVDLKQVHFD